MDVCVDHPDNHKKTTDSKLNIIKDSHNIVGNYAQESG
ncbi:hypothetical protein SAMN05421852_102252 [Thermoflavimicrobium dichotomicum]|uniref:Uncharacterized protein n=1 Tax=Thermoflavimicrobium dichotomicum TaxID=46223 RepID=A0A1I3LMK9_9BACL|nr:hypothetical protein SAMN05421852_102252 [Thermoflavimicrobium dichotomicum]